MNPNTILEQLKDIHAPEAITWWPLAIGWWILGVVALSTLSFMAYFLINRYRRNAWRRAALKEFEALQGIYMEQANTETLAEINALLKRSIASAHANSEYLSFTDKQWAQFLFSPRSSTTDIKLETMENSEKKMSFLEASEIHLLSSGHYQAHCEQLTEASFKRIKNWIKKLRNV